jgi:iron complex transport system substrate-binding protein
MLTSAVGALEPRLAGFRISVAEDVPLESSGKTVHTQLWRWSRVDCRSGGVNEVTGAILDSALRIHRAIGPGLLESVYEVLLARELRKSGLEVRTQEPIPVWIDSERIEIGFRADLIVEGAVLVELKSVAKLAPVHSKQLLTYLRLSRLRVGLLLNFGECLLKDGITRIVNDLPEGSIPTVDRS